MARPSSVDVICFGELIVDLIAGETGDLTTVSTFVKKFGGAPANVAIGLSRLGRRISFIGQVGQDPFGDFLIQVLTDNQVDTNSITRSTKCPTTLAFVSQSSTGERDFIFVGDPGRDQLIEPNDLNFQIFKSIRFFHLGSLLQTSLKGQQLSNQLIDQASHFGCYISYDPNYRPSLWPTPTIAKQTILKTLTKVDVVKLNEQEAKLLTGDNNPAVALEKLWRSSMKLMIITLGADGCLYRTDRFVNSVKGVRVKTIDTTGAGDAFVAGLLDGLQGINLQNNQLTKNQLEKILRRANFIAAQSTTKKGAIDAFPTRSSLPKNFFD